MVLDPVWNLPTNGPNPFVILASYKFHFIKVHDKHVQDQSNDKAIVFFCQKERVS